MYRALISKFPSLNANPAPDNSAMPRKEHWAWLFLIFAIWFVTNPYSGITHDAELYAAQALYNLHPSNFDKDLFFSYGSQDNFTIFSIPYKFLITKFGLGDSAFILFWACQLLWICGAIRLFTGLLPERSAFFCLILLATTDRHYGHGNIFAYAEPFLTARIAAEAMALWAISFLTRNQKGHWLLATTLSILTHPLIGIWSCLLGIMKLIRVNWLIVSTVCGTLFAIFISWPLGPDRLVQRFDPEWLELVVARSPHLFLDQWSSREISLTFWNLACILTATSFSTKKTKWIWYDLLLLSVPVLCITYAGTAIYKNVLITQTQPWRILWLVQVLQWPALACSLHGMISRHRSAISLAILFGFGYIFREYGGALLLIIAILLLHPLMPQKTTGFINTCINKKAKALIVFILSVFILTSFFADWVTGFDNPLTLLIISNCDKIETYEYRAYLLLCSTIIFSIIATGCYQSTTRPYMITLLAGVLGTLGFMQFDQRLTHEKSITNCTGIPDCVVQAKDVIKQGSLVYWEGKNGVEITWFGMETAHYASRMQSAGRVFNREQALLDKQRLLRLLNWSHPPNQNCTTSTKANFLQLAQRLQEYDFNGGDIPALTGDDIYRLCADPNLDYVVANLDDPTTNPHPILSRPTMYAYNCIKLRTKD